MFYHQVLLQRKGQFGIIWMEAMQSSPYRVSKRQALQVNVRKSCADILDYIFARLRDSRGKRKRFSLYLSAHLMYGVISIWRKQVQILLADAQEVKCRVGLEIAAIESINLRNIPRGDQVNLPDVVSRVAEENPFFGSLKHFGEDWDELFQVKIFPDVSSSLVSSSPSADAEEQFQPEAFMGSPHTVSSKEEITLKEVPFSVSPEMEVPIPGEKDIPALNGQELELIIVSPEKEVALTLRDLLPDGQTTSLGSTLPEEMRVPHGEETPRTTTCQVEGRPKGEKKRRRREAEDLDRTQDEQPTRPKRPTQEQDITLELQPIEVSPRRRRHRRELFVDINKEMTKQDIRHNIATARTTCRQFVVQTLSPSTPAELFKSPGSKSLAKNPLLRRLWEKNRTEGILETESDKEMPIWSVPELVRGGRGLQRVRRSDSSLDEESSQESVSVDQQFDAVPLDIEQAERDTPSMEVVREGSLSQGETPQHSSLQLPLGQSPVEDASLGSRSILTRSQQEAAERKSSLERSVSSLDEPLAAHTSTRLDILPEEMEDIQFSPPHLPDVQERELSSPERRFISRCETEGAEQYTTFRNTCPVTTSKRLAAKCFTNLLVQCAERKLFVRQFRPYGEIYISTSRHLLPHSS